MLLISDALYYGLEKTIHLYKAELQGMIGGMKLFFRKYGQGPPLIFLHGLYGSSDNWVHIARAIGDCFTVYLPDMRNHGRSPWSDIHTYSEMSNDIEELVTAESLPELFIAGHSMGGKVVAMYAVRNPGKISGLFLGDITPFPYEPTGPSDEHHKNMFRIMTNVNPDSFASRKELENYLISETGEKNTKLVFSKNITSEKGRLRWRINAASLANNLDNFIEGIPRPDKSMKPYGTFPVIVLKGDRSAYFPESDTEDLMTAFPKHRNKNSTRLRALDSYRCSGCSYSVL